MGIDLYVMIFMAVSFYITISEQLSSGLGIEVVVIVQIDIGVWLFAIICIASMIYSMLFLFFDEQKQLNAIKQTISDKKEHSDLKFMQCMICRIRFVAYYGDVYFW